MTCLPLSNPWRELAAWILTAAAWCVHAVVGLMAVRGVLWLAWWAAETIGKHCH